MSLSVIWLCHWPTVPVLRPRLSSGREEVPSGATADEQLLRTLMRHWLEVRNTRCTGGQCRVKVGITCCADLFLDFDSTRSSTDVRTERDLLS